jgi:hypothetical protein
MRETLRKEEGAVIVVAIFIVLALVVIGSLAMMFTNIELDISRNDRLLKEAFFVADAGNPVSTKVLREMILNEGIDASKLSAGGEYENFTFNSNFLNEVRNYYAEDTGLNDKDADTTDSNPDIQTTVVGKELAIDVDWRLRKAGAGGSVLFAMGYEGIGADRSHGGVKIYYDLDSRGVAPRNTSAEIGAVYLYQ